jgi:hypothetical protein
MEEVCKVESETDSCGTQEADWNFTSDEGSEDTGGGGLL